MESAKLSALAQRHGISQLVTLLGSILVALGSGTNYIYSAYAPQLGARLQISHTQLNIIGLAGNMGASFSGPLWGRVVDHNGPRIPLMGALICLFVGYLGIRQMYDDGLGNDMTVSPLHLALLLVCSFMTGLGGQAGLVASINTTAKSFSSSTRATTTSLVLSGFGLSAFWFSLLAHVLFPGDASGFLLVLALGTAIPMLIGLFVVKPVPLHLYPTIEGYDPLPDEDGIIFVREVEAAVEPEVDIEEDSEPPFSHRQESCMYRVPVPSSSPRLHERRVDDKEGLLDIHGKRLWLTPDFYLIFAIMGICGGTGLMYINNVGSISQALYAKTHTVYDVVEASKWQAAQVSILSLGNFTGRILIGLVSDFTHTRFHLPRAYYLCIVSSLFIISQASAIMVSSVETLWVATLLLGVAYGSLFGGCPTVMIEWFGMAHFSENLGFVFFSPILGGNIFAVMFGRNLDAHVHAPTQDARLGTRLSSLMSLVARGLPSEHQCFDGKECYLGSLQVTFIACIISLGLSWWAGIRDGQKIRARNVSA